MNDVSDSGLQGLLYYSFADVELSPPVLRFIMTRARIRNKRLGLTGLLHYENGMFFQWLEGPPAALSDVREIIRCDPHHDRMQDIFYGPRVHREFAGWDMAYSDQSSGSFLKFMRQHELSLDDEGVVLVDYLLEFFIRAARLEIPGISHFAALEVGDPAAGEPGVLN